MAYTKLEIKLQIKMNICSSQGGVDLIEAGVKTVSVGTNVRSMRRIILRIC